MFRSRNELNKVVYKCTVRLLEDDSDVLECEFQPSHKGKFLIDYVCEQLGIAEKDYFSLRFVDSSNQRHWLDQAKSIIKQVKDLDPILFSFRVKFYPADPFRLSGNGKVMLYQQLKRDLRHGRLYCSAGEGAALGSLIVQEELGDYEPEIHTGDYVSSLKLALRQSDVLERKVMEMHQKREPGQDPNIGLDEFLSIARGLETYGIDPHAVKDHRGTQLYLGINHSGISTFAAGRRVQHFRWNEVHKINFEGRMFIAHLSYTDKESREPKKHTVGFKCPSGAACRYVWRCAIEQMLFFTLPSSQNASVVSGGGFFSWGTKFKYSGRTEREILTDNLNALRQQHSALTSTPKKRKANSVPATPSSPQGDLADIRYSSLPRSTMSEPHGCSDQISTVYCPENTLLETVSEEARRNISGDGIEQPNDFYFRDSFDESTVSVDGPMANNIGDPRYTHRILNTSETIHNSNATNNAALVNEQNATNSAKNVRKFSLLHAFVPSFIFVVISLLITTIFILETDSEFFAPVKNLPEMVSFKYQYYQPAKEYFSAKISNLSDSSDRTNEIE